MKTNETGRADLHVHTNLSLCAPGTTFVSSYLPYCGDEGVDILGISNHLYAHMTDVRGADYMEYILRGRKEIEAIEDPGVRIIFGCESELFYGQEPGLSHRDEHNFDYVLLAPSHIFNQMGFYRDYDLSDAGKVRDLILKQFERACMAEYEIPSGICHPLYPICCPWEQEVVDGMTDSQLTECFELAREKGKSIEIHACLYRHGTQLDGEGLSPSYLRILSFAKKCGCKFHFGSDAHAPDAFIGSHARLRRAAERIGINGDDMWRPWEEIK